jgi:predicted TIM-barrel fold metal-dependent hydrolase
VTKIFDFHLHPGYDFHAPALSPEAFVEGLKAHGVCGCAGTATHQGDMNRDVAEYATLLPQMNREAYEMHLQFPDFYHAGIHIHPNHVELSCKEVEHYAKKGVRLVGELVPYLMGWRNYADPHVWEILEVVDAHGMVLSFHPNKRPEDMLAMIKQFPHLQIVIAHLDGYGLYDFAIETMQKHDNVYFDISAHGTREGMLADAVSKVGADRILYGTDYPGYDPAPFIESVLNAKISEGDKEKIFYGNAVRLLAIKA